MTYKELFPRVVERDRTDIKHTVVKTERGLILESVCNARIEALLEDTFRRGVTHGKDTMSEAYERGVTHGKELVLDDPSAYDLFSHQERD